MNAASRSIIAISLVAGTSLFAWFVSTHCVAEDRRSPRDAASNIKRETRGQPSSEEPIKFPISQTYDRFKDITHISAEISCEATPQGMTTGSAYITLAADLSGREGRVRSDVEICVKACGDSSFGSGDADLILENGTQHWPDQSHRSIRDGFYDDKTGVHYAIWGTTVPPENFVETLRAATGEIRIGRVEFRLTAQQLAAMRSFGDLLSRH